MCLLSDNNIQAEWLEVDKLCRYCPNIPITVEHIDMFINAKFPSMRHIYLSPKLYYENRLLHVINLDYVRNLLFFNLNNLYWIGIANFSLVSRTYWNDGQEVTFTSWAASNLQMIIN